MRYNADVNVCMCDAIHHHLWEKGNKIVIQYTKRNCRKNISQAQNEKISFFFLLTSNRIKSKWKCVKYEHEKYGNGMIAEILCV